MNDLTATAACREDCARVPETATIHELAWRVAIDCVRAAGSGLHVPTRRAERKAIAHSCHVTAGTCHAMHTRNQTRRQVLVTRGRHGEAGR